MPPTSKSSRRGSTHSKSASVAMDLDDASVHRFVDALTIWFDAVKRDLPWRKTRDPYAIWLSEIMLQQTRVDTVIPYFHRFLSRFGTVDELASADEDAVLALWSGLGYYRRARELHHAAQEVVARFGGALPATAEELRSLPGIGRYTAGAIASIAFSAREPLVDGNVARVFARHFGIEDDVSSTSGTRALWSLAGRLVPADRPGRFNEALMELGATVCTPRDPRCGGCPLAQSCVARAQAKQHELPRTAPKSAPRRVAMVAAVVRSGANVLLARRESGGLFGGLWEPPMVEAESLDDARKLLSKVGVPARAKLASAGSLRHILSHRELGVEVVTTSLGRECALGPTAAPYTETAWKSPESADLALSTLARKVLAVASSA